MSSKFNGAVIKTDTEIAFDLQTKEGREAFLDYQLFYQNDEERHLRLTLASTKSSLGIIAANKRSKHKINNKDLK